MKIAAFRRAAARLPRLVLAAALLGSFSAGAQTTSEAGAAPEQAVVQVTLNGITRGSFMVYLSNGEFLIRAEDLRNMGLPAGRGRVDMIGGEPYVWASSVPGLSVRFDEGPLVLRITAELGLLPRNVVDLGPGETDGLRLRSSDTSAFINYSVGRYGSGATAGTTATAEVAVRGGEMLFVSEASYDTQPGLSGAKRLMTRLVHDEARTLGRTTFGDFFAGSGELGGVVNLGGFQYAKQYAIDPYFVRYPQQNIVGQTAVPAEADILVNGQRVRTVRLAPGEFELRNLVQAPGLQGAEVVLRDAFGREQRITSSFYFSEQVLRKGLHEYSYSMGVERRQFGLESNGYGRPTLSAFHRFGISDEVTVGLRGEAGAGLANAGPTANWVLGTSGVLSAAAAASRWQGQSGAAGSLRYVYAGQPFAWSASLRRDSRRYQVLGSTAPLPGSTAEVPGTTALNGRKLDASLALSYVHPRWGSFGVSQSLASRYSGLGERVTSLSYGVPILNRRAILYATLNHGRFSGPGVTDSRRNDVFVFLNFPLEADKSVSMRSQRVQDVVSHAVQYQSPTPSGVGLGYTVGTTFSQGSAPQVAGDFQYNARYGIVRGHANDEVGVRGSGSGSRSYQATAAGGVAWIDGQVIATQPIQDSFALAKVGTLAGVRVMQNGELMGHTDAKGQVLVPRLLSYINNPLSVDTRDLPMDYSVAKEVHLVAPRYRGGAVVDFAARQLRAFSGRLQIDGAEAAYQRFVLETPAGIAESATGRNGEFYLENLKPGDYRGQVRDVCDFRLVVPAAEQTVTELGPVHCVRSRRDGGTPP